MLLFLISLPMLGAASPEAVRKLMSLTDKVRPHNPKHPMPPVGSPFQGRRPTSPRYSNSRPLAVHLSPESSSVVSLSNLGFRKPSRTGKQSCGHCLVYLAWVLVEVGISVVLSMCCCSKPKPYTCACRLIHPLNQHIWSTCNRNMCCMW